MTFPTRFPYMTVLSLVLAVGASFGIVRLWQQLEATPLQAFYLWDYVRSFVPIPKQQMYFVVTSDGMLIKKLPAKSRHTDLDREFYGHGKVLKHPAIACGVCLFAGLLIGSILDGRRRAALMRGIQTDGRRIVTPEEFNKRAGRDSFVLRME